MASPEAADFWPHLMSGAVGTLLGSVGTIILALLNRQPTMQALIDARIAALLKSYEEREDAAQNRIAALEKEITELRRQFRTLEDKIDRLTCGICNRTPSRALLLEPPK